MQDKEEIHHCIGCGRIIMNMNRDNLCVRCSIKKFEEEEEKRATEDGI